MLIERRIPEFLLKQGHSIQADAEAWAYRRNFGQRNSDTLNTSKEEKQKNNGISSIWAKLQLKPAVDCDIATIENIIKQEHFRLYKLYRIL